MPGGDVASLRLAGVDPAGGGSRHTRLAPRKKKNRTQGYCVRFEKLFWNLWH